MITASGYYQIHIPHDRSEVIKPFDQGIVMNNSQAEQVAVSRGALERTKPGDRVIPACFRIAAARASAPGDISSSFIVRIAPPCINQRPSIITLSYSMAFDSQAHDVLYSDHCFKTLSGWFVLVQQRTGMLW